MTVLVPMSAAARRGPGEAARCTVPGSDSEGPAERRPVVDPGEPSRRGPGSAGRMEVRRQINHDIHHELGTIMLLASLLSSADDVGPASRQRAQQILGETRWLDELIRAFADSGTGDGSVAGPPPEPIRLDLLAAEVVAAVRLSTSNRIRLLAKEAWAYADRLAFWRALRNVIGNAVRAAGSHGDVEVRVETAGDWTVAQVDDSGPGFGSAPPGIASLGLGIAQQFATASGGELEICDAVLGGCRVRIRVPSSRLS
jgi:signal transduction histidine kinase